jgi:1-acyl-sn-glycerol-3-phosphate acyltransferase
MEKLILFLRSLLFSLGFLFTLFFMGILSIFLAPFPYPQRYKVINIWVRFVLWWLKKTCKIDYIIKGVENIPKIPAAIIFCKHQSTWETFVLQVIFPLQVWVLKRELLWVPFFGWGLAMTEPIAIDRKSRRIAMQKIVEQGIERLKNGRWVVIFPEGTRVAVGQTRRYGAGGAMLAIRSGFSIVPVAHDAGKYWHRKGFIKQAGTIQVSIGQPIDPRGKKPQEINDIVQTWIENEIQSFS